MDTAALKKQLDAGIKKVRVNTNLHPEVKAFATKIGGGNVSRGVGLAVIDYYERLEGKRGTRTAEIAENLRTLADELDRA